MEKKERKIITIPQFIDRERDSERSSERKKEGNGWMDLKIKTNDSKKKSGKGYKCTM